MENAPSSPVPALAARLVVEPAGALGAPGRGWILPLPAVGETAMIAPAGAGLGPGGSPVGSAPSGLDAGPRPGAGLVEVLPPAAGGTAGLRVLFIPPRGRHATAGGWLADPPVLLLHERESVVLECGPDGAAWTLHLTAYRRPIGPPSAAQRGRPCPVCRRPIGEAPVYRCACGASLHHQPRPAKEAPAGADAGGSAGPGLGCARVVDRCPVCQRPVRPDDEGYTWLPPGFVVAEPAESAASGGGPQ